VFGNLKTHYAVLEAVREALYRNESHGYGPSVGALEARHAVAEWYNATFDNAYTAQDVILASGCSGAVDLCVSVLANPGQNILIPRPGFSLYETLITSKGIQPRFYDLLPGKNWEIDLASLERSIDADTTAVILNNPSNPCGSVFSREHLRDVLAVCERRRVMVVADEIYSDMVFATHRFHAAASLSVSVPVITVGGLAKKWLVPGWRMGWLLLHDPCHGALNDIRHGLHSLSQQILGPNTLIQAALPDILTHTPARFYRQITQSLESNAHFLAANLRRTPALNVIEPQGAMYLMVGIDCERLHDINSDVEFSEKLLAEESVACLPGACFRYPNYVRLVFTAPQAKLKEAADRIDTFIKRHLRS